MAPSTTVSQRKKIKRKAPRGFLKRVFKRQKPHLRLETSGDLLKSPGVLLRISVESLKRSMYRLQQR
uniref:Centromere protein W n=1 Tax=Felis catus TaxID=9685 RepID=A0ABI7X5D5_FELCA